MTGTVYEAENIKISPHGCSNTDFKTATFQWLPIIEKLEYNISQTRRNKKRFTWWRCKQHMKQKKRKYDWYKYTKTRWGKYHIKMCSFTYLFCKPQWYIYKGNLYLRLHTPLYLWLNKNLTWKLKGWTDKEMGLVRSIMEV